MLGPFRIRNLRRSTSPPNRASYAAASRRGSLDTLVSIKGPEYDYNVLMHPESKLKYLDEDDGEMVTVSNTLIPPSSKLTAGKVGTSLELSQRLDEPVSRLLKARLDKDTTFGGGNNVFNTSSSLSHPTHVFEIDRRDDAVRIWEEIEERSRHLRACLALKQSDSSTVAVASPSTIPPGNNMTQQAQFPDLSFQSLQSAHGTLSEALYPLNNDPQQSEEEVAEQNELQQDKDEYTMFKSDRLAAEEYHAESDEIRVGEDGSADLVNRSRHLCHEKCDHSDHKQRFQEASPLAGEAEDEEQEEEVLKELEAISSQDGLNVSYVKIPGRLSLDGASANICLDPNCAMSLVDSTFLQKHLPGCPLVDIDPIPVRGIGETFLSSNKFAIFDLYIPCNGNKIAKMSRGARVVENLPVHVLVGMDIIAPEGITINISKRLATIASCESLQVPLSISQSTQEPQDDSMQKNEPLRGLDLRSHSETLRNWPTVSGACRYCRRRKVSRFQSLDFTILTGAKIRCHVAQTSSDGRCMNCVRFEQDCKFISKHGQAWNSPPTDREVPRQWQYQSYYSPIPPHDPRLHYFTASNPPQLAHEKSEEADKPAHHTSMRVSDVLNDENEAKEVCEETAPLLESFTEGNLTAEGKRRAMEAGKRLRLRSMPAFQMVWNGGLGSQQMNNKTNRWAQYRSTESGTTAATRSSSTVPVIELAQPASPLLVSPLAHTESVSEIEGSLLHAFRTELAKISNVSNDESVENDAAQKNNMCAEKAIVQEQPRFRPSTSGPELEAFTRNLILQTIASIGSNVETLKAQLQNHVLDVIPEHMIRPRATPIKYHLRNACSDFKSSIDAAREALAVEPSVEDNTLSQSTVQLQPPLHTAIRSLQAMTYAFDTLSQRLRMIEDSKVPSDRNEAGFSSLGHAGTEEYGEHKASQAAITPVDNSKATVSCNPPRNEKIEPPVQRRTVGPSVRFWNTQAPGYEDSEDVSAAQNTIRHRSEPPITYRHVPSPMPLASLDTTRGRQPPQQIQTQTSALPSGHVNKPSPLELQHKRRSMPEIEHRRESRSRSRSPDASMAREMPVPRRSEAPNPQLQRSGLYSSLPIRHHHLASGPGRSNLERHSTITHGAVSSGYRPLPQQRLINKASHVRFGGTSVYPPNGEPLEDKNRLVAAASLRHSKSLSAIRKAPPPLNLTARKDADTKSRLSGTLNNSFNDRKKAELHVLGSLATANAPMSYAIPSSPLVATRFPTLEQFEDSNRRSVPQFPPLPSMETLIPVRVNTNKMGQEAEADTGKSRDSGPVGSRADQKLATYQKERAQQRKSTNESSGDFFRRMTGLEESSGRPSENNHFNTAPLGARLIKPFDPLAETATIHRHQLIEGVRRSATISGLPDRYAPANRRPYSAYFDGNGRVEWGSFLGGQRNSRAQDESNQLLAQRVGDHRSFGLQKENSQRDDIRAQQTEGFHRESTITREEASTPLHHDASTVSSVQFCVDQLKDLGFGKEEDGGAQRLVVYAQAANGNLEVAMDMIDEEEKAYKERSGNSE
ncbi:hypothetical protein MMC27_001858 [Xylographa pallens]|nr:hypothetical protein [Xylographa pallens]